MAALLLALAWAFGLVSLGYMVGKRMQEMTRQEWAPAVAAGLGTFLLVLVINGMRSLIPCIFWVVPAATGMVGLGAVILTRFGTQTYPPFASLPPAGFGQPPLPPAPPAPPRANRPSHLSVRSHLCASAAPSSHSQDDSDTPLA